MAGCSSFSASHVWSVEHGKAEHLHPRSYSPHLLHSVTLTASRAVPHARIHRASSGMPLHNHVLFRPGLPVWRYPASPHQYEGKPSAATSSYPRGCQWRDIRVCYLINSPKPVGSSGCSECNDCWDIRPYRQGSYLFFSERSTKLPM